MRPGRAVGLEFPLAGRTNERQWGSELSSINIKRAVENIRSGTTVYTPVVELIVNAIQAIRAVKPTGGSIGVTVLRHDQVDMIDKIASRRLHRSRRWGRI